MITLESMDDVQPHLQGIRSPIVLVLEPGNESFCGAVSGDLFGYRVGVEHNNIHEIIRDFTAYESAHQRTPVVFLLRGASIPRTARAVRQPDEWVVHSTDEASGKAILAMGRMHSHARLRAEGMSFRAFGRTCLKEPADYYDLINFATLGGMGPEVVVASKEHGRFCNETDAYHPGFRFYFNVKSLQEQQGYIPFMGGHAVRGSLALDTTRFEIITVSDVAAESQWTPSAFTAKADQAFKKKLPTSAATVRFCRSGKNAGAA